MPRINRPLLAALVAALALVSPPAIAGPPLSDYVIFGAHDQVKLGGGSLITGLVGSGFVGTQASERALILNAGADLNGDARCTWHVQLNNGCFISGSVIRPAGTTLSMGNPAGVGADVIGDPELPVLPPATPFASGGASYTGLGNGVTLTLAPGSYGTVALGGAVTVNFTAGNYYFDSFSTGNGATLNVDLQGGQFRMYVTDQARFGSVDVILISGGAPDDLYLESHWVATGSQPYGFTATAGSDWIGNVFVPDAGIHFGGSAGPTTFYGRFHAGLGVNIEHGVTNRYLTTAILRPTTWSVIKSLGQSPR